MYYLMLISIFAVWTIWGQHSKKHFIIGTWLVLFLFEACRKYELWGDLIGYYKKHLALGQYENFSSLLRLWLINSKDIGYYITEWIAIQCGVSFQLWITIIAFVFLTAVCVLIYKKSIYPMLSILTFIALGLFSFSLSGLRQTVAIAIVIWSYYFLEQNKKIRFILLIILASYFHKSAVCFLIILPIARKKLGKWHIIIAGICGLGFTIFNSQVQYFLSKYVLVEGYAWYAGSEIRLNYTGFIIQCSIFAFGLLYYKQALREQNAILLYNLSFMGMVLQLYASFIAEFFRISMYFSVFNMILIPLVLKQEKDIKLRNLLLFVITGVLVFYILLRGGIKYEFFWR